MRCNRCGTELLAGKRFCHACGARAELTCGACGAPLQPEFRFCPDCGASVEPTGGAAAVAVAADDRFARLAKHIPAELASKIRASSAARGERKLVTVVFCDLVGSTAIAELLDPEEYRDLLEQYLELAFREIYRFEGIVNQLAGDGMMALFGAPVAHEDAPQRAIRAALAVRAALDEFNQRQLAKRDVELQARIGIHTGPVVVGTVGNDFKMDYTATGDTTNLAARLESMAAPGVILISEATYRSVRGFFELRPTGPFTVKGKSEPVAAYEVLRESETTTSIAVAAARGLTPLVGRDDELVQLRACFDQAAAHKAQIVGIAGGAGSGKSRLIYEFKRRLPQGTAVFFEARCSELTRLQPYAPIAAMLRPHFRLLPGEPVTEAREKVAAQLRAWSDAGLPLDRSSPYLLRLLSLPTEDLGEEEPEDLKRNIYEAVEHVVMAVARGAPAVVVIEDLHWIDEVSRELIELAVERMRHGPLMLIISHRPEYMPLWRAQVAFTPLDLHRLGDDDTIAIIRAIAGGALPAEVERLINLRTEGNPFFAEEITRVLVDDGVITRGPEGVTVTRPPAEIPIPHTVQEVLEARLDRLGAQAKRVAQVAAVLGRQFHRQQLAQLLAPEGIASDPHLAELERRGIIHRKNVLSGDEYRFGESLTQEVAYEGLLLKERRQLHERVGQMLEEQSDDAVPERAALAALHFARSDNRRKAVEALLRAGNDSERRPSWSVAEDFYRQAWGLAEALLEEGTNGDAALRRLAMEAAKSFGRINRLYGSSVPAGLEGALQRGRELAEELGDVESVGTFLVFNGMYLNSQPARAAEGVRLIEEAFSLAQRSGLELQAINISRALASAYLFDGHFVLAQRISSWAVTELERLGHGAKRSDLYVSARWMRDNIFFHSGELKAAEEGLLQTYAVALEVPNRTIQILSASTLGQLSFVRGQYAKAKQWITRGLEEAHATAHSAAVQSMSGLALAVHVALGEEIALADYLPAIEQGIVAGGNGVFFIRWTVEALLELGAVEVAQSLAQEAHTRATGRLKELLTAAALGAAGTSTQQRWSDADQWLQHALTLAHSMEATWTTATLLADAAQLAQARSDAGAATRYATQALALCRGLGLGHYERKAERVLRQLGEETSASVIGEPQPASSSGNQ